jgi:hypothetical protein
MDFQVSGYATYQELARDCQRTASLSTIAGGNGGRQAFTIAQPPAFVGASMAPGCDGNFPTMSNRTKGRWVVYERRNEEFIFLSRFFTTRAQAEKEREKLKASFTYKRVSLGVGFVVKAKYRNQKAGGIAHL